MSTLLFKENIKNYGVVTDKDKIPFEFELKEGVTPDQIDYIYPDCGGCTTVRVEGNKVIGEVNAANAGARVQGNNNITKMVFVKIKDGQSFWISDPETKLRKYNDKIQVERLQLVGIIQKTEEVPTP